MKFFSAIALVILIGGCTESENKVKDLRTEETEVQDDVPETIDQSTGIENTLDTNGESVQNPTSEWSYKVVLISEGNWGYQIFEKGIMKINQTTIPSVQGINGFNTAEKAEITAEHILNKVENGIFPPTVNQEELEKLGVLRD